MIHLDKLTPKIKKYPMESRKGQLVFQLMKNKLVKAGRISVFKEVIKQARITLSKPQEGR